jgi:hypothetical protein
MPQALLDTRRKDNRARYEAARCCWLARATGCLTQVLYIQFYTFKGKD